jgi:hypothetical protein
MVASKPVDVRIEEDVRISPKARARLEEVVAQAGDKQ